MTIKTEFQRLTFSRNDETETYSLTGRTPEGEWVELTATWLKVNGIGFSAPEGEFSQYKETVTVKQESEGGGANIIA